MRVIACGSGFTSYYEVKVNNKKYIVSSWGDVTFGDIIIFDCDGKNLEGVVTSYKGTINKEEVYEVEVNNKKYIVSSWKDFHAGDIIIFDCDGKNLEGVVTSYKGTINEEKVYSSEGAYVTSLLEHSSDVNLRCIAKIKPYKDQYANSLNVSYIDHNYNAAYIRYDAKIGDIVNIGYELYEITGMCNDGNPQEINYAARLIDGKYETLYKYPYMRKQELIFEFFKENSFINKYEEDKIKSSSRLIICDNYPFAYTGDIVIDSTINMARLNDVDSINKLLDIYKDDKAKEKYWKERLNEIRI